MRVRSSVFRIQGETGRRIEISVRVSGFRIRNDEPLRHPSTQLISTVLDTGRIFDRVHRGF